MAIDALDKYDLEFERKKQLEDRIERCKDLLYSYESFQKDFINYSGLETNKENNHIKDIIIRVYNQQLKKSKDNKFVFLDKIKFDGRIKNSIVVGNQVCNMNINKLDRLIDCFLDAFEKNLYYSEIYLDVAKFLLLLDNKLVIEMFESRINKMVTNQVILNRIEYLQKEYNSVLVAMNNAIVV